MCFYCFAKARKIVPNNGCCYCLIHIDIDVFRQIYNNMIEKLDERIDLAEYIVFDNLTKSDLRNKRNVVIFLGRENGIIVI